MLRHFIHIGFSKCASSWLQGSFSATTGISYVEKSYYFSPLYKNGCFNQNSRKQYCEIFRGSNDNEDDPRKSHVG